MTYVPRLRSCVQEWPECVEGYYDPRCCRFPKSCSCTVYDPNRLNLDEDLEDVPEYFERTIKYYGQMVDAVLDIPKPIIGDAARLRPYPEEPSVSEGPAPAQEEVRDTAPGGLLNGARVVIITAKGHYADVRVVSFGSVPAPYLAILDSNEVRHIVFCSAITSLAALPEDELDD